MQLRTLLIGTAMVILSVACIIGGYYATGLLQHLLIITPMLVILKMADYGKTRKKSKDLPPEQVAIPEQLAMKQPTIIQIREFTLSEAGEMVTEENA
jgi:hypothetical protein